MKNIPDHPVIEKIERDGFLIDDAQEDVDTDLAYEERRERELFGDDL